MWQIIGTLGELFKWMRVRAELQARRELHEEIQRVTDEADQLEDDINHARSVGMPELGDRLLKRQTRLICYRVGLPTLDEERTVRPDEGHGLGDGVGSAGQGPANPGPAKS